MLTIINKYNKLCNTPSDINEHLPTLYKYTLEPSVNRVTECGVRGAVSSYAFAAGLLTKTDKSNIHLYQSDLDTNHNVVQFGQECAAEGVPVTFYQQSDLECPMEPTDLLFIDTWHIYGHLKRELNRWHPVVSNYIILHDTTVDAVYGETVRIGWNAEQQSQSSGIPVNEITKGLWPAVEEFLAAHPEWTLEHRYTNNNGLTILRRVA